MKKTLLLLAVCGLGTSSALAAADAFTPQSIIRLAEGTSAGQDTALSSVGYETACPSESVTTIQQALEQAQMATTAGGSRHAVVKDGQGELTLTGDVALQSAFMVREGTVTISNGATLSNSLKTDGCNLAVSGINAKLVLDNAHFTTTDKAPAVCSAAVGSLDGDGELTLINGSTFYNKQTLFTGNGGSFPLKEPEKPEWDMGPHYGGTYAHISGTENNGYYCYESGEAGFSKLIEGGTLTGTAVVNVLSGSHLDTGYGLYVGNTTLTLDGAGSQINSGLLGTNDNVNIGSLYGITAEVNITNGGVWTVHNEQYLLISRHAGKQSSVTITGGGSMLDASGWCMIGDYQYVDLAHSSASDILISKGGRMNVGIFYVHGAEISHNLTVEGQNSVFHAAQVAAESGIDMQVADGAAMTVDTTLQLGNQKAASLELTSAAQATAQRLLLGASGSMSLDATSTVILTGSTYNSVRGTLENNGTISNSAVMVVWGTLKGSGSFGATEITEGGRLIVGNSPGHQSYDSYLDLYDGTVEFSVDDLLNAQAAGTGTSGWGSGTYSVIDMQGNELLYSSACEIAVTLGTAALGQLNSEGTFELVLVQNIGNAADYTDTVMNFLLSSTTFAGLNGEELTGDETLLRGTHYEMRGSDLVLTNAERVPEPATATLSLLALGALAARRRRNK